MKRCRAFDQQLMADAEKAGGRKYAELLALTYRHSITAHKLLTRQGRQPAFSYPKRTIVTAVSTQ